MVALPSMVSEFFEAEPPTCRDEMAALPPTIMRRVPEGWHSQAGSVFVALRVPHRNRLDWVRL